jgi:hypothetical protein
VLAAPISDEELAAQADEAGRAREDLVPVAVFMLNPSAAQLARAALKAAEIPCYLENEYTLNADRFLTGIVGGERLLVPAEFLAEAREVLTPVLSEEELAAEAEAASTDGENV